MKDVAANSANVLLLRKALMPGMVVLARPTGFKREAALKIGEQAFPSNSLSSEHDKCVV